MLITLQSSSAKSEGHRLYEDLVNRAKGEIIPTSHNDAAKQLYQTVKAQQTGEKAADERPDAAQVAEDIAQKIKGRKTVILVKEYGLIFLGINTAARVATVFYFFK